MPNVNHQQLIFELRDFSFSFNENESPSISDVNLRLFAGEISLLLGASGSGKSTLTLCLNGLYPDSIEGITSGELFYKGEAIQSYPKGVVNQQIGMVFQDPDSQFCMVRVEDELAFVLENLSIPRNEMKMRIEQALDIVGLSQYIHQEIHQLSGGQKQKLALASVLLMDPQYLILDEPTANLDPISTLEFIETIIKVQKEKQFGLLVIEHETDDWETHAHRLIALKKDGGLLFDCPTTEGFTHYLQPLQTNRIRVPKRYVNHDTLSPLATENKDHEPCISLTNITFAYRKQKQVLHDVTFSISKGDFCAIVGENGGGKSTLLQLMARLKKPAMGSIALRNRPLNKWEDSELRQRIGYVFQSPEHQFICQTVYDEVSFGMKLNGYEKEKTEKISERLLTNFDLIAEKWKNPFSLSGGQKRRLSVATMLHSFPDLLLFDEPTFGQDAYTTDQLLRIVMDLKKKGTTIVFITHDMDIVDRYCNNVIVMHKGTVSYQGSPQKLWKETELMVHARLRLPYRVRSQIEGVTV